MKTRFLTLRSIGTFGMMMLAATGTLRSQSAVYDNFDGTKVLYYHQRGGVLDTMMKNPHPDAVNGSAHCALYVRNGTRKFDNIKMALLGGLGSVDKYATYLGVPPHFKLKVFTSAPPGTLVEILLGSRKGNNDYPAGTHSQYQAYTKKTNEWEELEFLFSQIPQGSETSAEQIDQVVLLFNPNSSTSDTWYFDDLTGPPVAGSSDSTGQVSGSGALNVGAVETSKPEINPNTTGTLQPQQETKQTKKNKKVNKKS